MIGLFPFFSLSGLSAQTPGCPDGGCDLSFLYSLSLKNDESMAMARERVIQADERYRSSRSLYLPELSVGVLHNYRHTAGEGRWYSPWISAKLYQRILTGLDQFTETRRAAHLRRQAAHMKDNEALLRFEEVARLYYSLLEREEQIKNVEEALLLSRRYIALLSRRNRLGRSRASDLLRERALLARLEAERESALHDRDLLREELSFLVGIPAAGIVLRPLGEEGLPEERLPSLEEALASVERRPDIRAAREYKLAAADERASKSGSFFPEIYMQGEYFIKREPFGSSSTVLGGSDNDWYIQLGMEVPLYSGGSRYHERKEYLSREREASLLLRQELRKARSDVRAAHLAWTRLRSEEKKYREARDLAVQYQRAVDLEYGRGIVTGLELVRARQDLLDAKEVYEVTRHRRALAELRYLILSGMSERYLNPPPVKNVRDGKDGKSDSAEGAP